MVCVHLKYILNIVYFKMFLRNYSVLFKTCFKLYQQLVWQIVINIYGKWFFLEKDF